MPAGPMLRGFQFLKVLSEIFWAFAALPKNRKISASALMR
jgi:hypothetical protein